MRSEIHTEPVTNSRQWKELINHVGLTHRDSLAQGGINFEPDTPTCDQINLEAKIERDAAPPNQGAEEIEDEYDSDSNDELMRDMRDMD